jgi:hypothetical protein
VTDLSPFAAAHVGSWPGPEVRNIMKTAKRMKTGTARNEMGSGHSKGSMARKGLMAIGAVAAIAIVGKTIRKRRAL